MKTSRSMKRRSGAAADRRRDPPAGFASVHIVTQWQRGNNKASQAASSRVAVVFVSSRRRAGDMITVLFTCSVPGLRSLTANGRRLLSRVLCPASPRSARLCCHPEFQIQFSSRLLASCYY